MDRFTILYDLDDLKGNGASRFRLPTSLRSTKVHKERASHSDCFSITREQASLSSQAPRIHLDELVRY